MWDSGVKKRVATAAEWQQQQQQQQQHADAVQYALANGAPQEELQVLFARVVQHQQQMEKQKKKEAPEKRH